MRRLQLWFVVLGLVGLLLPPHHPASAQEIIPLATPNPEFFGIVGRDPLFTLDVDGHFVAPDPPAEFLERMAADLANLGARWVRIEFRASAGSQGGPGAIDYSKYDFFIRSTAPRYGLKVLALLNSAILADGDVYYWLARLEDPPDGAGGDPTDGSNNYSRVFADRAREIANRYGTSIAAYELFNEPNVNTHKYVLTGGTGHELKVDRFATLATNAAIAIRQVNPRAQLVLGGLLNGAPVERPGRGPADYLADVYQSPRVQWFYQQRPFGPDRLFPWDAVALHPYDLTPDQVEQQLREVKARLLSVGDGLSRLWITEIGRQATPPALQGNPLAPPTFEEEQQAAFLTAIYSRLLAMPEIVERVFWFKYEDFREAGIARNWGLVRLREHPAGYYDPAMVAAPRKLAYVAYQRLANPAGLPQQRRPAPGVVAKNMLYFSETGQTVVGPFKQYWERHGGLARFGLPRTAAFEQAGRLIQYFERARFEYYPEFADTVNEVQLGLLGDLLLGETPARRPAPPLPAGKQTRYFPETGHNLSHGFKAYWEKNDGHRLFGLPLTEELRERNPSDGQEYTVQYFERARFEYHPERKGTPFEIQLGLLGNQFLESRTWYR